MCLLGRAVKRRSHCLRDPGERHLSAHACGGQVQIRRSFAAVTGINNTKDSLEKLVQNRELSYVSLIQRDGM